MLGMTVWLRFSGDGGPCSLLLRRRPGGAGPGGRGGAGGGGVSRAQSAMLQIQEKSRTLSRHDDTHTAAKVKDFRPTTAPKKEMRKMKGRR